VKRQRYVLREQRWNEEGVRAAAAPTHHEPTHRNFIKNVFFTDEKDESLLEWVAENLISSVYDVKNTL